MTKPIVFISKCITFEPVRYSGQIVSSEFVDKLKNYIVAITSCPEVEIGLGIPRDPIRIIEIREKNIKELRLIQPSTNIDLTEKIIEYSKNFLQNLGEIDGFILKAKSPSCGIRDVKVYDDNQKLLPLNRKNPGFFGGYILKNFSNKIIEDEQRLIDGFIKDNFLKSIYLSANFRICKQQNSISSLIKFHEKNKFLLMSYNQQKMRMMGKIVANAKSSGVEKSFYDYEILLGSLLSKQYKKTEIINVFEHIFGYFKKDLSQLEKKFFLTNLQDYSLGRISQLPIIILLKSYMIRFEQKYILNQSILNPYPQELMW